MYSTERFKFDRIYQFEGEQKAEGVSKFVRRCLAGKEDIYFENKNVKEKYSWKIVGQDFEKVVLESDRDCLVLITNSVRGKNEGFDVMYEEFVKENCTKYNKSDILLGRLNAINEVNIIYIYIYIRVLHLNSRNLLLCYILKEVRRIIRLYLT